MAPPRNMKMMRKGTLVMSCLMVPRNGLLLVSLAAAALGEGGEGGRDDLTPQTVRMKPGSAGRNQIRFKRGILDGSVTMIGVIS